MRIGDVLVCLAHPKISRHFAQDPLNAAPEYKRNSFISYTGRETEGRQMSLLYQGGDDLRQRGPRATLQGVSGALCVRACS